MAGTPLDPQSFFTSQFMLGARQQPSYGGGMGGGQMPGGGMGGGQMPQGGGIQVGANGQPQLPGQGGQMGGAAPQNYLDSNRNRAADPYAPSPPPMAGGGNPIVNFLRGATGQSVESGSDRSMRNWQNQEAYKSAYRAWQSDTEEWNLKRKAYEEGQTQRTMLGKNDLAIGASTGTGDPETDPNYALRPMIKGMLDANPELKQHPELLPGLIEAQGKIVAPEERARLAELKHNDAVAKENEIKHEHGEQDAARLLRIEDAKKRTASLVEYRAKRLGQLNQTIVNSKDKNERDAAVKERNAIISDIRTKAQVQNSSMDEDQKAGANATLDTALRGLEAMEAPSAAPAPANAAPAPANAAPPAQPQDDAHSDILDEARKAIAQNRDPNLVRKRLQDNGIDPSRL